MALFTWCLRTDKAGTYDGWGQNIGTYDGRGMTRRKHMETVWDDRYVLYPDQPGSASKHYPNSQSLLLHMFFYSVSSSPSYHKASLPIECSLVL